MYKKDRREKRFPAFRLSDRIPGENFYRRLKDVLRDPEIQIRLVSRPVQRLAVSAGVCSSIFWRQRFLFFNVS
ncbi:MAG: hypothetical protein KDD04_04045, partial [Sinomicrobium sp.]|nr:hypothetical protein [Sinomicrobium sp.]